MEEEGRLANGAITKTSTPTESKIKETSIAGEEGKPKKNGKNEKFDTSETNSDKTMRIEIKSRRPQ